MARKNNKSARQKRYAILAAEQAAQDAKRSQKHYEKLVREEQKLLERAKRREMGLPSDSEEEVEESEDHTMEVDGEEPVKKIGVKKTLSKKAFQAKREEARDRKRIKIAQREERLNSLDKFKKKFTRTKIKKKRVISEKLKAARAAVPHLWPVAPMKPKPDNLPRKRDVKLRKQMEKRQRQAPVVIRKGNRAKVRKEGGKMDKKEKKKKKLAAAADAGAGGGGGEDATMS
mmetsp:Transcript_52763/g.115717  ORF Transcript_52763/g.115717 Transcript_52763/m.115717 type:complete len:230 (-) Transcript_52763:131-820(-)